MHAGRLRGFLTSYSKFWLCSIWEISGVLSIPESACRSSAAVGREDDAITATKSRNRLHTDQSQEIVNIASTYNMQPGPIIVISHVHQKWSSTRLDVPRALQGSAYLINQTLGPLVRARAAYCSLLTNEFSPEGLRCYFGGNGASKYTKNHLFHCRISTLL